MNDCCFYEFSNNYRGFIIKGHSIVWFLSSRDNYFDLLNVFVTRELSLLILPSRIVVRNIVYDFFI